MMEKPTRRRQDKPRTKGEVPAHGTRPSLSVAERFRRGLTPKQITICIAAIVALLLVILSILIFALSCGPSAAVSSSFQPPSLPASDSSRADDSFDPDAFSRVLGEYAGVLLEETPDAGAAYVKETLFLGDSNTARMVTSSVDEVNMSNAIGIESMGITSVLGLRCVRFSGLSDMSIPSAVAVMQPRRIVINFGTNNAGMNTETFINSYRSAIEGIQKSWPYADIFVASVFPISQGCTYGGIKMSHIEEFNIALLELSKEMNLHFLNWSDTLKDASGYCQPQYMTKDGVHLSDSGIQAIFTYFRTHHFEGEDTRPMPLKAIPKRLPTPEGLFPKPASSSAAAAASSSSLSLPPSSSQPVQSVPPVVSTPPPVVTSSEAAPTPPPATSSEAPVETSQEPPADQTQNTEQTTHTDTAP